MEKLAFLGTGLIGAGLAEAAVRRGADVRVWNRTRSKAGALAALGATVAASAAEAVAGAERVHVAVRDDAAVDAVLAACAPGLAPAAVLVDHTTTSPAGTARRARAFAAEGRAFLHAPVFMSPQMCREARGIMLLAGPRALAEAATPALAAMTGTLEYLGERTDLAAAYKLFGNAMIFAVTAGLADVFALATALGVPAPDALGLFAKFNPAATLSYRGERMAQGDYRASFELAMARKDAGLMLEAAGDRPLSILPALAARMDALLGRGLGADDLGVLAVDAVPKRP
ncbi:MAG: NAD(P)-dependent oxidoreductase [Polyangiaceae bacterium]|nr:NAD(P)-dependent oxidoreductase [Polyangiaceae bacterium]